jgi:hypothetical protein
MKGTKKVKEEHIFHFRDGSKAHTLQDLKKEIADMSDDEFNHHVAEDNNDFANWVEFCHKDQPLAADLRKVDDRKKTLEVLEVELGGPKVDIKEEKEEPKEIKEEEPIETIKEAKPEKKPAATREITTEASHKFIVKEFVFGLITGLILGLVTMGVLMQLGIIP